MRALGEWVQPGVELGLLPGVSPFEALARVLPERVIRQTIVAGGLHTAVRRRLPPELVLSFVIALGLWARESMSSVLATLVDGLRERHPEGYADWRPPSKSALTQARQRLGPDPLRRLFRRLAYPLASTTTPGAFRFGLRLMAIDGTTLAMPDTPANAQAFGRSSTRDHDGTRVNGPWPLIRVLALVECGTHLICDAVLRPYRIHERRLVPPVLRSVRPGMLVLLDQGFNGFPVQHLIRARGADFLGRTTGQAVFVPTEVFADGSYLAEIFPTSRDRQRGRGGVPVRVIEYVIDDPARPNQGQRYRLVTSLLDPSVAPSHELALLYHERWEIESTLGEVKVLQTDRSPAPPLRSGNPREIVQEVYGLLIAHLVVRRLMLEAAATTGHDPDQMSFTGTLRLLRRAIPRLQRCATTHPLFAS